MGSVELDRAGSTGAAVQVHVGAPLLTLPAESWKEFPKGSLKHLQNTQIWDKQ